MTIMIIMIMIIMTMVTFHCTSGANFFITINKFNLIHSYLIFLEICNLFFAYMYRHTQYDMTIITSSSK